MNFEISVSYSPYVGEESRASDIQLLQFGIYSSGTRRSQISAVEIGSGWPKPLMSRETVSEKN